MPESIRDGKGKGYLAEVTVENRLRVSAVSRTKEHHANVDHGEAYNIHFSITPSGADQAWLYIQNNSERDIVLEGGVIHNAADEQLYVYLAQNGTPVGGTAIIPANLNAGSGNVADGTFQEGANITGLTGGWYIGKFYFGGLTSSKSVNFEADIVVPKNKTCVFYAAQGSVALEGFLTMWHEHGGA